MSTLKLLLAIAGTVYAAVGVTYTIRTLDRDTIQVVEGVDNTVSLVVASTGYKLQRDEARDLACALSRIALRQERKLHNLPPGPDSDPEFDRMASEAARETDAQFCAKATLEWQRKAFCHKERKDAR